MGTCNAAQPAERIESPADVAEPRGITAQDSAFKYVQQLLENRVEDASETVALIFEDRQLTYDELNARANQLASHLRNQGVGPESIVGLRVERSPDMIVGIFGILKAGGAYLPIDPAYPSERQQFMLQDAGVNWLLSQSHLPALDFSGETFLLDRDWPKLTTEPTSNPSLINSPDDLAYVIYTSGSSGKPKGVQVRHRNLSHSTLARFRYYAEPVRNFLLLSSHSFDSSVAGIFWTLCQGGTLTLPHEYSQQTAFELADLIAKHRVSHLLCLPSLYAVLLEQFTALSSLRTVIVAGESCPVALVKRHHDLLPNAALFNEYGPTEATVWSTVARCDGKDIRRNVSIGHPILDAQVYVLDSELRRVPNGASGELFIGGAGVSRGYLNRPELTAEKFIPDPFSIEPGARLYKTGDLARALPDGRLEFLGRIDNQIKIRGHRIELEEIEALLKEQPGVQDVVVTANVLPKTLPVNGEAEQLILRRLTELAPTEAERLLGEFEEAENSGTGSRSLRSPALATSKVEQRRRQLSDFDIGLTFKNPDFIKTPRASQRDWLLNRALDEFADDLQELDQLAKRFVPGAEAELQTFTSDRTQAELSEQEILEDWHLPLMKAMARSVTETHGDILEIGFGRGVASSFLQECGVRSHTIIECNDSIIRRFYEPWRAQFPDRNIRLVRGKWQDVIESLGEFDGIFFQTYPLNEREFMEYLSGSIVFAEHFFPIAARHLRRGGAFTYLTHEIDSLSRRHQRLILQHFGSLTCSVERLQIPPDCRDLWWSDSMIVTRATK